MKTLTAALAASRTVGDACALKSCALAVVENGCLADAEREGVAIRKLNASENALQSVDALESSALTWLSLENNALGANALAALGRNCPRIRTLNVSGNDGLKTLRGVEHMHALAALIAKECGIDDLSAVKGLKELNTLACAECEVRDVGDALSESPALRKVNLSKNKLTKIGIDALKSSRGLRELRLAHNALKTIPACVASTPNLRILDVGHNNISDWGDLSALRDLNRLEQLTLRGCPIADDPEYAEKIARMCPGLKLLDGRPPRDARGRDRDRARDEKGEREDVEEEPKKKMKKGKEKERLEKSGEDEEGSFVEAFVTKNKGRFVEEEENPAEDDGKDSTKRTGVVGVFENKELKRKGPCGSAALTALLSKNDGGSGLHAGTWDDDGDDDDDERDEKEKKKKKKTLESKTSKKKDLREMTPEERKKHLRLQRKRGY